jgi:ABC-2 type transport system permease protein
MKLWHIFIKTLREQLRSGWDLAISIALAPMFVLLYWIFIGTASTATYPVLALNLDQAGCSQAACVQQAIQRLENITYGTNTPVLRVQMVADQASGEALLRNRQAVAMVTFPAGYAAGLEQARQSGGKMPVAVQLTGDLSHPYYPLVGVIISTSLGQYADEVTGRVNPLVITEKALGNSAERSEFDLYIPGLLIASIVMILFSVSITIAREVEAGTARRLVLTAMGSFDYLGGISLVYLLISLVSVLLTFCLAVGLGFHYYGSIALAVIICLLTAMGSIAAGILTACFSKTMSRAAVIANIPLLLLLFLSGAIFPLPYPTLFSLWGHHFTFADILPTTHAVNALNKVLGLGAGIGEVGVELGMLVLLTALYFFAGVRLFRQLQMK